jgi:GNAT superfamily N-acetyltransferase
VVTDDVAGWVRRYGQDTIMVVHGRCYDVAALPALVAVPEELIVGVLSYVVEADALEIVLCHAQPPRHGVGRALVNAAVGLARQQSLRRVWCTTTNDNLAALGFWQAVGFALVALRPGAVTLARRLKPTIPLCGYHGLPIRDELDLELQLPPVSTTR